MRELSALICCACAALASGYGGVDAAWAAAPPEGAERAPDKFTIQAFDIQGVTILPVGEVEGLVYPFAGPDRNDDDVEAARKALQDAYAARGLGAVVVEIPLQDRDSFSQGIVQIAVSEVPLGQLRVTDSRYHSLWVVRRAIPSLVEGKPIDIKALQADVNVANRFPDRTINPIFKPGRAPGTLDVELKVDDRRPLHASLEVDNDASPSTTPLRAALSVRYTNLFQKGQAASFTYINAPQNRKETEVFAGSYSFPLLNSSWALALSGYHSNSNVASLGGSSVLGNGYQVGLRAIYHLPSEDSQQTISFGPDFKNFKQKINVGDALASSAPVRYVPLEIQYAISGASENTSHTVSLGATMGLRAFKSVVCIDVAGTCLLADAFRNREQYSNENFVHANLSIDYTYAFQNDTIAAFRLAGQLADSHLITNEQFSGGGLRSVRGYYSSEAVGDNGISPSVELRSPSLAPLFGDWITEARFFAFADATFLSVLQPLAEQTAHFKLVGLGGGLRLRLFDRFSGSVLGAMALTDGPVTKARDARINFEMKGEF